MEFVDSYRGVRASRSRAGTSGVFTAFTGSSLDILNVGVETALTGSSLASGILGVLEASTGDSKPKVSLEDNATSFTTTSFSRAGLLAGLASSSTSEGTFRSTAMFASSLELVIAFSGKDEERRVGVRQDVGAKPLILEIVTKGLMPTFGSSPQVLKQSLRRKDCVNG
mmetsp:Transcript_24961/g.98605  ORF Transcript_24961/g.98605 Transcript_24961/m.98605 type:complete len:168 (+) Transcript_24961:511-1014(+)